MRQILLVTLLAIGPVHASESASLPGLQSLDGTQHHRLTSESTSHSYHILVGLPDGYDQSDDRVYPTVYILDGGELFPLLRSYSRYLNNGKEAPQMILVGISYGTDDWRDGNNRSHDFTAPSAEREFWGGAADFQVFLRDKLIPMIESTYRSDAERRIVFGQSLGGQFVLYTAQTEPGLFWGHIASNPALHRNLEFFLETVPRESAPASQLFVASASDDDPVYREPALAWIDAWSGRKATPWRLETTTLDGHNHFSAPPASFRQGIIWLFNRD